MTETEIVKDWRGTPIVAGALVIYGAPVGRSIAMVEAEVVGFTKSGRVNVRVRHRAYGGWGMGKDVVHVGPDRLTIVSDLPPTDLPLETDKHAEARAVEAERKRIQATHDFTEYTWDTQRRQHISYCRKCGLGRYEAVYDLKVYCTG